MFTENNYEAEVSLFDTDCESQEEDGFVDTSKTTDDFISEFNGVIDALHKVDPIALKDAGYLTCVAKLVDLSCGLCYISILIAFAG